MTNLLDDLRHALRSLRRRPGFSLIVVATTAIGVGANVAMFAYLSYFLWPTLEAPEAERVAWVFDRRPDDTWSHLAYADVLDLGQPEVFEELVTFRVFGTSLTTPGRSLHAWGHAIGGGYFQLFGARPQLGRFFTEDDDRPGAPRVAVLNHFFWQRHFGGDPQIVGRSVELDGRHPYAIVGVARQGFQGQGLATGIYVPIATADVLLRGRDERTNRRMQVLARLAPGATLEQAASVLSGLARGLDAAHPGEHPRDFYPTLVTRFNAWYDGDPIVDAARALSAAVALLLLLAAANIANLLLARATARRREMAVHAALGASRWRLGRRLFAESLLLAAAGGLLGLGLAGRALRVIEHYLVQAVPVGMGEWAAGSSLAVDAGELAFFAAAMTAAVGLLFGAAPVLQLWRQDLVTALKTDTAARAAGRRLGARQLLVVGQVALSVVLLIGAGLMTRTLAALRGLDIGLETAGRTIATAYAPADRGDDTTREFFRDLLRRTRELPGVAAAGLTLRLPASWALELAYEVPASGEVLPVSQNIVTPGYFESLGIALSAGRDFTPRDRQDAPGVVVVNRTAAEKLWPGRSPLGERVILRDELAAEPVGTAYEVVGIVADSRYGPLAQPVDAHFYFSFEQRFRRRMSLLVHASGEVAGPLREMLHREYPELAILDLQPLSEQLRRTAADQRMNADFAGGFGLLGLLLAALGVFSVMSYTTLRRRREFGIRMALGADRTRVGRMVLGESGRLVALGLAAGLAAAWVLARYLASVLSGVDPHDPLTFVVVPAVLAVVSLAAATVPTRRAVAVDPMTALREE